MDDAWQDLRHGLRSIRRNPMASAAIAVTLALGIGANSAVFSFVDAVLVRPMPFPDAHELVRLESVRGSEGGRLSLPELADVREEVDSLGAVASYRPGSAYNVSEGDAPPEEAPATLASRDLFAVLGVEPMLGGPWPESYDRERAFGVVLGHGFWQRRFGGDPTVLGRTLTLDAAPNYTVYGIMPPGFTFPGRVELFRSGVISPAQLTDRENRGVYGLGRLRPGASLEVLQAELDRLARRLEVDHPESNRGLRFRATPLREVYVGEVRPYLVLLQAAVACVLLIACVNVANLLLARALRQGREAAVHAALGAGRVRLLRRHLTETVLLALAGGALGLAFARLGIGLLDRAVRAELPPWVEIALSGRVLAVTSLAALVTGVLVGLIPALQASRSELGTLLKQDGRGGSAGRERGRLRRAFVVAQVALSVLLLVSAGLVVQSFERLRSLDPGLESEGLWTFRIALPWMKYRVDGPETLEFYDRLTERLEALAGVEGVAFNNHLPFTDETTGGERPTVVAEGQTSEEALANPFVDAQVVSDSYFRVAGVALEAGRSFGPSDLADGVPVAVVGGALAERLWPGQEALGRRLRVAEAGSEGLWMEVVGVARDIARGPIAGRPGYDLYLPFRQSPDRNQFLIVRTSGSPEALLEPATRAVWEVDPDQSSYDHRSMTDRIEEQTWQRRVAAALFSVFGLLAGLLAAVGIYGVMSSAVGERHREMGIRAALGSAPAETARLVLGEALRLTGTGVALGLVAAAALTRVMSSLLYQVSATDPTIYAGVALGLASVAAIAAWLPARRASRIDPVVALRPE